MKKPHPYLQLLAALGLAVLFAAECFAQENIQRAGVNTPTKSYRTEPIYKGFVVIDGRYIPSPYILEWTGESMYLNGIPLPTETPTNGRNARGDRLIARLEQRLCADSLLLTLDGEPVRTLTSFDTTRIFDILLKEEDRPAKIEALVELGITGINSGQWAMLVQHFHPTSEFHLRIAETRERFAAFQNAWAMPAPSQSGSGLITVASMILAVIGLGTILSNQPNGNLNGSTVVVRCVALLAVLNLFDLVCTLTAFQSGTLWELNPLATPLLGNTTMVVAYKAGLTFGASALLVTFREHRLAQLASWWCCVLYTVLVFRWATFNSVFMN